MIKLEKVQMIFSMSLLGLKALSHKDSLERLGLFPWSERGREVTLEMFIKP